MALIVNGDMPTGKGCDECEFQTSRCEQMDACTCYLFGGVIHNFHNERHENCPIIGELPDSLGDLVSRDSIATALRDYLLNHFGERLDEEMSNAIYAFIAEAETIVEATE